MRMSGPRLVGKGAVVLDEHEDTNEKNRELTQAGGIWIQNVETLTHGEETED